MCPILAIILVYTKQFFCYSFEYSFIYENNRARFVVEGRFGAICMRARKRRQRSCKRKLRRVGESASRCNTRTRIHTDIRVTYAQYVIDSLFPRTFYYGVGARLASNFSNRQSNFARFRVRVFENVFYRIRTRYVRVRVRARACVVHSLCPRRRRRSAVAWRPA